MYVLSVLTRLPYLLMGFKGTQKISQFTGCRPLGEISKQEKNSITRTGVDVYKEGNIPHPTRETLECDQQGAGFRTTVCYGASDKQLKNCECTCAGVPKCANRFRRGGTRLSRANR